MATVYTLESVRAQMKRFIDGEVNCMEMDSWLDPLVSADEGDPCVLGLAYEILLHIYEYTGDYITLEQARDEMRPFLTELPEPSYPSNATPA